MKRMPLDSVDSYSNDKDTMAKMVTCPSCGRDKTSKLSIQFLSILKGI